MARLIQDTIRKALADELLFGRLSEGGSVIIDHDESADKVVLQFDQEDIHTRQQAITEDEA